MRVGFWSQPANVSLLANRLSIPSEEVEKRARQPNSDQIEAHIIRLKSDELYAYFLRPLPLAK
jgi:hypothetical protein